MTDTSQGIVTRTYTVTGPAGTELLYFDIHVPTLDKTLKWLCVLKHANPDAMTIGNMKIMQIVHACGRQVVQDSDELVGCRLLVVHVGDDIKGLDIDPQAPVQAAPKGPSPARLAARALWADASSRPITALLALVALVNCLFAMYDGDRNGTGIWLCVMLLASRSGGRS